LVDGGSSAARTGLRILVIDSDPVALEELASVLAAHPVVAKVGTCRDAAGALRALRDEGADVVFLELDLAGVDGGDLAWVLRQLADPPEVVFVSACAVRAVEAFELGALDYLLKPVPPERVARSLSRVPASRITRPDADSPDRRDEEQTVMVQVKGRRRALSCSNVRWLEAHGDYVRLHTADGQHLVGVPLGELADRWAGAGFLRIHRSYVVQLRLISEMSVTAAGGSVVVDGHRLPVSRRYGKELSKRMTG